MIDRLSLIQTNRSKKYEGTLFNLVEIVKYVGSYPKSKIAVYECKCTVCNLTFISSSTNFTDERYKNGCKACSFKVNGLASRTHGFKKSHKTYKSWCKIKERCFNKNDPGYAIYGARGITMQKEFVEDFMAFYAEVGEPPEHDKRWSIDRIDPNKGYVQGNIRWANIEQQARNKRKSASNSSGVTGVQWYEQNYNTKDGVKTTLYAIATWSDYKDGKPHPHNKKFSVTQLGLLPAFAKAVQFRLNKIKELNQLDYGYTEHHGL
jgi:hypothetical protein